MPATVEAVAILVAFVLPGFILANVYNRNVSRPTPSDTKLAIESIGFGAFNHLVASPFTLQVFEWYERGTLLTKHTGGLFVWCALVIFLLPILFGSVFSLIVEARVLQTVLGKLGLSVALRTSQAWDYFFQQREGCWVLVHLKSGSVIGGIFGRHSFASLTPHPRDLYLEQSYEVKEDGTFGEPLGDTLGEWIDGGDIERVQFFKKSATSGA